MEGRKRIAVNVSTPSLPATVESIPAGLSGHHHCHWPPARREDDSSPEAHRSRDDGCRAARHFLCQPGRLLTGILFQPRDRRAIPDAAPSPSVGSENLPVSGRGDGEARFQSGTQRLLRS